MPEPPGRCPYWASVSLVTMTRSLSAWTATRMLHRWPMPAWRWNWPQRYTRVTVGCSGLHFLDGAGLRFLVSARGQAQASGGDLIVTNPLAEVRRVLEVTGCPSLISMQKPDHYAGSCPGP